MESMRSLNKSLPSSQSSRQAPPEQLLQAFRTAALSVTNLYKSAVTDQADSRKAGYQDALEDLLKFLDQENIGVQDGEGWRIREWATQRYDGGGYQPHSETEDDQSEPEVRQQESSPGLGENNEEAVTSNAIKSIESEELSNEDSNLPQLPVFQFRGNSQPDRGMQTDDPSSPQAIEAPSSSSPAAPIRVEVLDRNRASSRPHTSRHSTRSNQRDFTFTAGTKRKLQFPDFFDISNIHDKREGSGGGSGSKRGRFV